MGFRTGLFLAADSAPMSPSLATLPLNAQPEVRVRWTRAEWMLVIGATALAVGLGWLGRAQEIGVDEATHLALAKSIASGHYRDEFLVGRPVHAKYPPLMSLWLVVIRFVTGSSLDAVRAVNLVLHALSATIIGDSLRRLGWPRLGVAALAVIALNPSLLDLAGTIRSETLYITLTSVALWSSLQHEWGAVRHGIVTIAAAGAAFLTRSAGIAIVAAVAIVGARRHRFFVLGMALAMITIVATWFLFSFGLGGDGGGGASYAFDLSRIASTPVTAIRHAGAVMLEYAIRTPFTQFGLPNLPTKLDTMVAGIGIPAFAVLGMIRIARTWPIAVVNLVLGLGVLLVWPWIDGRFLAPLVPSLVAMMLIGIADGSRRWAGVRAEWVAVATAIVFVLSAVGTGVRTAKIGLSCRQEAASLVDPRCNHTETRAIAPASRFVRDSVPRDAVIATPKNALVYHISGHETVRYYTRAADGQLAFLAPQSGVDYLIVATIGVGFGRQVLAELASACGSLRVVREFPLETILLARRLAGDGPESACTTVSRIQSRTMRRE